MWKSHNDQTYSCPRASWHHEGTIKNPMKPHVHHTNYVLGGLRETHNMTEKAWEFRLPTEKVAVRKAGPGTGLAAILIVTARSGLPLADARGKGLLSPAHAQCHQRGYRRHHFQICWILILCVFNFNLKQSLLRG